ncbi:MAG: DUF3052 domain-containing protein, partial [Bacteroidota bacterium]
MRRTLTQKLGIKAGYRVWLVNVPDHYFDLLMGLPEDILWVEEPSSEEVDFIHLFILSEEELENQFPACKAALKKTGMLWVSWPKKSSSIRTDLHRDFIREYILEGGLVDAKVVAVDQD